MCPQAQHDSVIANQPLHPITILVNTDVNDNNNNNTISNSTALFTLLYFTVETVDMVYTVDTAYTVYTFETVGVRKHAVTYGHYDNIWQCAFCRNN